MYEVEELECIDDQDPVDTCRGPVELRMSLSGTGTPIPRCDHHWSKRLDLQEEINDRYGADSDVPPSWFKAGPGGTNEYGERWDDEY